MTHTNVQIQFTTTPLVALAFAWSFFRSGVGAWLGGGTVTHLLHLSSATIKADP